MLLDELHSYYGTWSRLTKELDLGTSTYQVWLRKGYVPYTTQLIIEKKTNGKFTADESHGRPEKAWGSDK